jgi:HAE1 family hydrophobic/amphiphilic exporter-1
VSLTTSSIRYPVSVAVGVLLAMLGGFLALTRVPIQLTPEVREPLITVTTAWPGASPEEVEREIIQKQEKYLKSVGGVREMTSESHDGWGTIAMEFGMGTDITVATVRVSNKLNEVPSYPESADQPVVASTNQFDRTIAWFVVSATADSVYLPHMETVIEDMVQPRLERVDGVAAVNIFGGLKQELHVTFEPELLASMQITIPELRAALQSQNRTISAGDFGEGKRRYVVRTVSRFETVRDVEDTIIARRGGVPIHVRDVADVEVTYEKPLALVRNRGRESIAFNAQSRLGANILEVLDGLMEQIEIINREVLEPRGMNAQVAYRSSLYIDDAIDRVFDNLYLGAFLAVMTLFLFLRSLSAILIISLAIPISAVTAFLVMFLFGRSINVISLAGMAFAVGMVVDNAIVVLENIYRHIQMGKPRRQAAADGTKEVWGAVLASTLTTIAVFFPIIFVQERAAQLFRDIAIAISSAIFISLLVAMTVIPTMSARLLDVSMRHRNADERGSRLGRLAAWISGLVDRISEKPSRRRGTILGFVAVSIGLSLLLLPASEYLPNGNQNFVFGFLLPPPGYNIEEMVDVGRGIEGDLAYLWETPPDEAGGLPAGGVEHFFYVAFPNQAFIGMSAREARRTGELLPVANGALFSVPGAIGFASQMSLFSDGFAGTRSIKIDITGPELEQILRIAMRVFGEVGQVLPGSSSRPIPGLDLGNPEVRIIPDRARAADVGFTATDIGISVNALVDGMKSGEYWHEGREIDLILKGHDRWSRHTQDIVQLPLASPTGRIVTLGDVSDVRLRQGPVQINHVERQRAVSIETILPDDLPLEEAIARVENEIVAPLRDEGLIGGLYDIRMSGAADDLSRLREALTSNFVLVIVLTYLLLSALFQSFAYPLVILLTVPLATFGGVLGLRAVQLFDPAQQLDVLTMLGFVILVGTVINNSILIVYQALHLMRGGMDARDAVRESVRVRVRPIFMSTGTSILGMLPLVVMPGAGSELYRGLGSVVVGGLALSSVFTLVLTPLVFTYAIELTARIRGWYERRPRSSSSGPARNGRG